MLIDIHARGFSLTSALRSAVEGEAREFAGRLREPPESVRVRLFDVNGPRGGRDKGCLVYARVGRGSRGAIATYIDDDLYRAIGAAFARLTQATRATLNRGRSLRRARRPSPQRSSPAGEV
jgi:hypothetical protein